MTGAQCDKIGFDSEAAAGEGRGNTTLQYL